MRLIEQPRYCLLAYRSGRVIKQAMLAWRRHWHQISGAKPEQADPLSVEIDIGKQ